MINKIKTFKQFITEEYSNRDLIVVDIQPSYKNTIHFPIHEFASFLNENEFKSIFYLFNGPDLGMEEWYEISEWLLDNGLEEEKLDEIQSFEKGYAFFRNFMDLGMDEDDLIRLLKYMYQHNINDSREIDEEDWNELKLEWDYDPDGECVFIPDVLFKLQRYNNPLICGGGRDECLREIELCMHVLDKPYELLNKFVF
jgi:hypothetical protein